MNNPNHNSPYLPAKTEVLIIGAGVVGAGIFRDLAKHNIPAVIVDKGDFSSQTSERSSKMLHGGIRYLENLDFGLVKEALHEKNLWLKLAPHLAYEVPFFLPTYKDSLRNLFMIRCGLMLYDFLSGFQNSPFKILGKKDSLSQCPHIKKENLKGCGVYYDAIVHDSKLTLECLYEANTNENCHMASYTELTDLNYQENLYTVSLKDTLNGEQRSLSAKHVIFATGPFTDQVMSKFPLYNWEDRMLPSKGSHLWISKERFPLNQPVVLTPKDGRVIFVIPHHHKVLVGTTEVKLKEDIFNIKPSEEEINYLLNNLNDFFPKYDFTQKDIVGSFAGVRPLVKADGNNLGKTAREHKIIRPLSNTYVIIGGKYTTFRVMGQEISREICNHYQVPYDAGASKTPLTQKSIALPYQTQKLTEEDVFAIIETESPRTLEDLLVRRIGVSHPSEWPEYFEGSYEADWPKLKEKIQQKYNLFS